MLKPRKHMNPELSVLHIGGLVIKSLQENNILKFDELLANLTDTLGPKVKTNYLAAVSFLFLMGKVKYHPNLDSFELVK